MHGATIKMIKMKLVDFVCLFDIICLYSCPVVKTCVFMCRIKVVKCCAPNVGPLLGVLNRMVSFVSSDLSEKRNSAFFRNFEST